MRRFWMTALMMAAATASAQTVYPTTESGDDQIDINVVCNTPIPAGNADCGDGMTASVQQTVKLVLPKATALHLDASTLTFDISKIGQQDDYWYCAYGKDEGKKDDDKKAPDLDFWNQTSVKPLGTNYSAVTTDKRMGIRVNGGQQVTQYPAIVKAKEVDNATKAYFVCYRSFIIQKFSNVGNFKLSVTRTSADKTVGQQQMFIQDNPCNSFGGETGLYTLPVDATRELIPKRMTIGTTGQKAAGASVHGGTNVCRENTSWLDDLVVIAVIVDGEKAGENPTTLTYTLTSSLSGF